MPPQSRQRPAPRCSMTCRVVAVALWFLPITTTRADEAAMLTQIERMSALIESLQRRIADLESHVATGGRDSTRLPQPDRVGDPSGASSLGAQAASAAKPATLEKRPIAAEPASAADPVFAAEPATVVSGYGELNYNRYLRDSSRSRADLRRFVIGLNHRFDERLSFVGEIEWEHAVTSASDAGESAIEQAYINYAIAPSLSVKTGLYLMPFGFINQAHEPPAYYGVERNAVETRIIPSTWREGGVGLSGTTVQGWSWDAGVTTGFSIARFSDASAPLASTHQEMQLANAHDLATYGALNYRGVPGLQIGGAIFRGNAGQGNATYLADRTQPDLSGVHAPVTLWETHARWQSGRLDLQALYARGTIGDAGQIDATLAAWNTANSASRAYVPSAFYGWFVQGAWRAWSSGEASVSPFVRYERFDTQASMPAGFDRSGVNADRVATLGLSFRPHPQVVFKADYQRYLDNAGSSRVNLGMGYLF